MDYLSAMLVDQGIEEAPCAMMNDDSATDRLATAYRSVLRRCVFQTLDGSLVMVRNLDWSIGGGNRVSGLSDPLTTSNRFTPPDCVPDARARVW
jgi:hypothetical protein